MEIRSSHHKMNILFSRQKFHLQVGHFLKCSLLERGWKPAATWKSVGIWVRGGEAHLGDEASSCLSDESTVPSGRAFQGHSNG